MHTSKEGPGESGSHVRCVANPINPFFKSFMRNTGLVCMLGQVLVLFLTIPRPPHTGSQRVMVLQHKSGHAICEIRKSGTLSTVECKCQLSDYVHNVLN